MNLHDLVIPLLNVTLLLSVGLELRRADLLAASRDRTGLAAATAINVVAIPAIAVAAVALLGLSGGVAAGVLLAACCPGGGTGTLLTRAARGSLERSVVLLGVLTMVAVLATPALVRFAAGHVADATITLWPMLQTLLVFQLTPLLLGIAVRAAHPRSADQLGRIARPLSNLTFALFVGGMMLTRGHLALAVGVTGVLSMTIVVVSSLWLPTLLRAPTHAERAAASLTTGVRNLFLALLLASTFFTDETTLTVLVYGLVMYAVAVPVALRWRRRGSSHNGLDDDPGTAHHDAPNTARHDIPHAAPHAAPRDAPNDAPNAAHRIAPGTAHHIAPNDAHRIAPGTARRDILHATPGSPSSTAARTEVP